MSLNNLQESSLVQAATAAQRPTRWWLAILFAVIMAIIITSALATALVDMVVQTEEGSIGAQVKELIVFAATFLVIAAWVRFKEGRPVRSLGFIGGTGLKRFLIGLAIGAGLLTLSVLLVLMLGQYEAAAPAAGSLSGIAALLPALLLVLHWSIQSSTEETVMRGYLVQTNALQLPGWVAILIPAIIFSLLHMAELGLSEPVSIINIVLFALFASFVALRQGSLWMACGIHAGWNWFQGNVFGVPVSGNAFQTGVFHLAPTETATHFLSGGAFGPENSLVVTIVWGVATVMAYRYFTSDSAPESASRFSPDAAQT